MKELFTEVHDKFELKARASDDLMKLFIDVAPKGKEPITRDEILQVLFRKMTTDQCDLGVIDDVAKIASTGEPVKERRIMKGFETQPGHDGKILLLIKKYTGAGEVQQTSSGAVDLRNLHLFDNVHKGLIVGRLYPPKPGASGRDVTGKAVVPKNANPVKLTLDQTLMLEQRTGEDFQVIVAKEEGYLFSEGEKLQVRNQLKISGNVDLKVGSIDFIGSVEVSGDVTTGMAIRAKNGIVVHGNAQEAILESSHGDVQVKGFLHGGGRGRVVSGRGISVRVAHSANLSSVGPITILREAVDCQCNTQTILTAPKAQIAGGMTRVVCGAEAAIWGNEVGTKTAVEICSSIEATAEYSQVQTALDQHEKGIRMLELHLGPYASSPARVTLLKEPFKSRMEQLLQKLQALNSSKASLKKKKDEMLKSAHKNTIQRVNAHTKMSAGVKLQCGDKVFEVTESIAGPTSINFIADPGEFKPGKLEALVCEVPAYQELKNEEGKK